MSKKKKDKIRFEVQLDAEDDQALSQIEQRSKLHRAEIVRRLIRQANVAQVIV